MEIFKECRQDQKLLLGPSLAESVPEDDEVSIINEVVDALDLSPLLSRYEGDGLMVGTRSLRVRLLCPSGQAIRLS